MSDAFILDVGDDGWLVGIAEFAKGYAPGPDLVDQDGEPLRRGNRRGWWIADARPESVSYTKPGQRTLTGARLRNTDLHEIDSARWPVALSADHYRRHLEDFPEHVDYEPVYDEDPVEHITIDLSAAVTPSDRWRKAVPEFDAEVLRRWTPDLAGSVLYAPEFGPWLPGQLAGFRAHMATLLDGMAHVTDVYCKRPASGYEPAEGPYFNVRQLWSDGRTATSGKGRNRRTGRTWVTIKVPLDGVPQAIRGDDLWDAVEKWERAEAEWLNRWDLIGAEACGHCNGRGWIKREAGQ